MSFLNKHRLLRRSSPRDDGHCEPLQEARQSNHRIQINIK